MFNNNIARYTFIAVTIASVGMYGCKDTVELPDQPVDSYNRVYMPEAVNGPIYKTFKIVDSAQTAVYGANFGGQDYPTADIPVTFKVDNSKIDSFNLANGTKYTALPDGSYTLATLNAVIPKGKVATDPLSINFKTSGTGAMDALKSYLLPVSIATTSVKVNENLRTTFYIVKAQPDLKDYPNYDRTAWQVIDFSSQEASGEGPSNGRAIFAFDGDKNTYWHTQWAGGQPGPPHFVTVDMGTQKTLHGFAFLARQSDNSGKPNEVNVQVSLDNITWTDAGTFNLQNTKDLQSVFLPNGFKNGRYFKVIINSSYNATYTHLAELNAF